MCLQSDLLCVHLLRLLLLLSLLPGFASDVGAQASHTCILSLVLHLLVLIQVVWAELARVRAISTRHFLLLAGALAPHLQAG